MKTATHTDQTPHLRSFRIQAKAHMRQSVIDLLHAEGFCFEEEAFSKDCFTLYEEPFSLGQSLAATFGYIYIQDRSSMLPPLALNPKKNDLIVDMCASPGSKTSFLAHLQEDAGVILANEPNQTRLATLRANLRRLDLTSCITVSFEGQNLPLAANSCDAILLDPPCSGWGTVEKNPKVLKLWKESKTVPLIHLQRKLLEKACELVRPGGTIIYSTCTTHVAENEDQIQFALDTLPLTLKEIPKFTGFTFAQSKIDACLCVQQETSRAQGFFIAHLVKEKGATPLPTQGFLPRACIPYNLESVYDDPRLISYCIKDRIYALPKKALSVFLQKNIQFQGCFLGNLKNGTFIPNAKCRHFFDKDDSIPKITLETDEIRKILQGICVNTATQGKRAKLYWHNLPLAYGTIKNGRITGF